MTLRLTISASLTLLTIILLCSFSLFLSLFGIEFQHIPNKPYYVQYNLHNLPAAAAEIEPRSESKTWLPATLSCSEFCVNMLKRKSQLNECIYLII